MRGSESIMVMLVARSNRNEQSSPQTAPTTCVLYTNYYTIY